MAFLRANTSLNRLRGRRFLVFNFFKDPFFVFVFIFSYNDGTCRVFTFRQRKKYEESSCCWVCRRFRIETGFISALQSRLASFKKLQDVHWVFTTVYCISACAHEQFNDFELLLPCSDLMRSGRIRRPKYGDAKCNY